MFAGKLKDTFSSHRQLTIFKTKGSLNFEDISDPPEIASLSFPWHGLW